MAMKFGKLNFAVGFNRTSAFPLDANSYFESYNDAVAAAASAAKVGSADSAYYIGQLIIVKDTTEGVGLYQINAGKTLTKFGQASSADELAGKVSALETRCTTIEGKLILANDAQDGFMSSVNFTKLKGIEPGAQVNKIESIKVNGTTLAITDKSVNIETEDLDTVLANYATNDSVTEKINAVDAKVTKNTNDITAINGKLTGLTGAMHFKGVVTEVPTDLTSYEVGDVVVVHNSESKNDKKEFVLAEVEGAKAFVELGDEGSHLTKTEAESTYLKKTDASTTYATQDALSSAQTTLQGNIDKKANQTDLTTLSNKVDGLTGSDIKFDNSTAEITIAEKIGQINTIIENINTVTNPEGSNVVTSVAWKNADHKITVTKGLKVYSTTEVDERLEAVAKGAIIKSVNETDFTITEDKLNLNDIATSKVTGLDNKLTNIESNHNALVATVDGHTTSIEGIETAIGDSTSPAEDTILGRIKAAENNLTSISNTIGSSTDTWDGTKNTIFAHIDHLQTQITSNASANVSTDRLVNGSKTLILNGGGAAKFETEE